LQAQELSTSLIFRYAGFNVEGKFIDAKINYQFNPDNLEDSFFNAEVKVASIDTGIKSRNRHLLKEKYFDAENYPLITFQSTSTIKEDNQIFILGRLTIKATTKELRIPLSISDSALAVEFGLNRRDYDVGGNSFILSDEVNIKLKLVK
jgi:polyisoprenoid-binding protein YceI